jgi:hypothetical protein
MIIVDATELASDSKLPTIPDAKKSNDLESRTGADFMISPLTMPITSDVLLSKHIQAGALLIQRKSGQDLLQSVTYRLYESLYRMKLTGARPYQCVLLSTGFFIPHESNGMTIAVTPIIDNGVQYKTADWSKVHYGALQSTLRHWTWYGGVYIPLANDNEIPVWAKTTEDRLVRKTRDEGYIKEVWPDKPDQMYDCLEEESNLTPLQIQKLDLVHDWRAKFVLIVDGVGPKLASELRLYLIRNDMEDTLMSALSFACTEDVFNVPGWGEAKMKAVREALYGKGE